MLEKFTMGTLFLIRTPATFPPGYAETCIADMKNELHLDYAAWLETWNCEDGILWKNPKYPRSSLWIGEERDPLEEVFTAADRHDMAFLPEAGVMHRAFRDAHPEAMWTRSDDSIIGGYSRLGLTPFAPLTLEYFIDKYETLIEQFRGHRSLRGVCLPCENSVLLSYDRFTREAYRKHFGTELPPENRIATSKYLEREVFDFLADGFIRMYQALSSHLKSKYRVELMHYPVSVASLNSHFQPAYLYPARNLGMYEKFKEIDLANVQIHPPLNDNPSFFKTETEMALALCGDKPVVADTHFYHEGGAGRLPNATPKRFSDWVLSTVTPYGVSFFCYGFFAPELPLWKTELNPGAPVFHAYADENTVAVRRRSVKNALAMTAQLRPFLEGTLRRANTAIYLREEFNFDYLYDSYPMEHLFGCCEAFQAAGVPTAFATKIPNDATEVKLLVFHAVKSFSPEEQAALRRYLAAGGRLFIAGNCHRALLDAAGLRVEPTAGTFVRDPAGDAYNHWSFAPPSDSPKFTEKNGEPVYFWENGDAAITDTGRTLYFGAGGAISDFSHHRRFHLIRLLRRLVERAGGAPEVEFDIIHCNTPGGHTFLAADLYRKRDDSAITLLIRNYGVETRDGKLDWQLSPRYEITDFLLDGRRQAAPPTGGTIALPSFEHLAVLHAVRRQ